MADFSRKFRRISARVGVVVVDEGNIRDGRKQSKVGKVESEKCRTKRLFRLVAVRAGVRRRPMREILGTGYKVQSEGEAIDLPKPRVHMEDQLTTKFEGNVKHLFRF
jgi:hypothetical protein